MNTELSSSNAPLPHSPAIPNLRLVIRSSGGSVPPMEPIDERVIRELAPFRPVVIYHFGSGAQGRGRKDSDVDLALLPGAEAEPYDVFCAAQRLAAAFGCDVDLIDLRRVGDVMRVQILGGGRRIFTGDARAADEFEMLALSGYARLNEERHEILARQGFRP
jgi:uncharacterized protein